jgi:hypothetical protein
MGYAVISAFWTWLNGELSDGDVATSAVGILFVIVGLFLGSVFAVNGYSELSDVREIKDSLRIKNLNWVLGTLLIALVADYRKFGVPEGLAHTGVPVGAFFVGFFFNLWRTLRRTLGLMKQSVAFWNREHQHYQIDESQVVRDFHRVGEKACQTLLDKRKAELRDEIQKDMGAAENSARLFGRHKAATEQIANLARATTGFLRRDTRKTLHSESLTLISEILKAGESVVNAYAPDPGATRIAASVMVFHDFARNAS